MPRAVEIAALVSLPRFGSRHDRVGPREDQNGCNKGRCDEFFHGETMRARPWRFHHKSLAAPKPGDAVNRMVANRLPDAVKTWPTTQCPDIAIAARLASRLPPTRRACFRPVVHSHVCRPLLYQLAVRNIGLPISVLTVAAPGNWSRSAPAYREEKRLADGWMEKNRQHSIRPSDVRVRWRPEWTFRGDQ